MTKREKILCDALLKVAKWKLPKTGKFWDKEEKEPMSYEAVHGSNGAREYMKNLAAEAVGKFVATPES